MTGINIAIKNIKGKNVSLEFRRQKKIREGELIRRRYFTLICPDLCGWSSSTHEIHTPHRGGQCPSKMLVAKREKIPNGDHTEYLALRKSI